MFNFKAFSLLLVAVVFGVGAAIFANRWLQEQVGTRVVSEEIERETVLVATRDIEFGQKLEEIDFKVAQWPSDAVPAGAITTTEDALGRIANQKLLAGEPLLEGRVVERLAGSTLSALISPNKRGVTIRVNDVAGVAGFLLPGNRVDVLGTRTVDRRAITSTVLQNVKVLAVDQTANPEKDDPVVVRAVTLEADLDESIKLVRATEEGTVQLVLRNPEDLATRIESLPPRAKQVAEAPRPRRAAPPPTVRIIRGTAVDDSRLR